MKFVDKEVAAMNAFAIVSFAVFVNLQEHTVKL